MTTDDTGFTSHDHKAADMPFDEKAPHETTVAVMVPDDHQSLTPTEEEFVTLRRVPAAMP